eukprot:superscaffoldBa00009365_g24043
MAGKKSVCCGFSVLEVMLGILFILMTAVSVSLITLMVTWKEDTGPESTLPPSPESTLPPSPESTLPPSPEPQHKPYLIGVGRADCTGPPAEIPLALQVKYGNQYRQDNVVLSGTHTHSGPAGYFQYTLFMITSKGYIKASIEPLVDAIVK